MVLPEQCTITAALQSGAAHCALASVNNVPNNPVSTSAISTHQDAKFDAQVLLCAVLNCNRAFLHTWSDNLLTPAQHHQYQEYIERRSLGEPVAYILGYQEFYGRDFAVSPATLIPRPETELLVDLIIEKLSGVNSPKLLDLGTGTGSIAITAALECPLMLVAAVDFVPAAVVLAKQNAQRLMPNDSHRITIAQSDWFTKVSGTFDLIVSNPPYVELDSEYLAQGDVRFEPDTALTAADNGLADIKLIIEQACTYLNNDGWLMIEHGYQQADSIQTLFYAKGFSQVTTVCDYAQHPRITLGQQKLKK